MRITELNNLDKTEAVQLLETCCGSSKWLELLLEELPFENTTSFIAKAESIWYDACGEQDWLEAFTHHPKIGDVKSLTEKFASTQHLAGNEQAGVNTATLAVIEALAKANTDYEAKFGFIFIVCATGKSAKEMLRLLEDRLSNTYAEELAIAMGEQHKITILRLKKLLSNEDFSSLKVSQITTHVLDTTLGKPGQNITIKMQQPIENGWQTIAQGVTNKDGRIPDLLPPNRNLKPGTYKMLFETGKYFESIAVKGFYPEVEIQFTVFDDSHYHVPLLVNPYGYSTYRGS